MASIRYVQVARETERAGDAEVLAFLRARLGPGGRLAADLAERARETEAQFGRMVEHGMDRHVGGPRGWVQTARSLRRRLAVDAAALAALEDEDGLAEGEALPDDEAVAAETLEAFGKATDIVKLVGVAESVRNAIGGKARLLAAAEVAANHLADSYASGRMELGPAENELAIQVAHRDRLAPELAAMEAALGGYEAALADHLAAAIGDQAAAALAVWEARRAVDPAPRDAALADKLARLDAQIDSIGEAGGLLADGLKAERKALADTLRKRGKDRGAEEQSAARSLVARAAGGETAAVVELHNLAEAVPGAFRARFAADLRWGIVAAWGESPRPSAVLACIG